MKVLLVEPYFVGSHRAWAEGLAAHSDHEVRLITHPGRWWKWRIRGAALTLAESLASLEGWRPDVVLASDMIDLAQFRFFARSHIGDPPTVLYFHESQLTYPPPAESEPDLSYAVTNWLSAFAADRVLFNSEYHFEVFFEQLPRLLRNFPELTHDHLIGEVAARCEVLPVGVDLSWIGQRGDRDAPPRLLWNHRWDHDKDPDAFAAAVEALVDDGADFELVLLGARPPNPPPALIRLREVAGDRIVHDAEAPLDQYRSLVTSSDVVVSTARQEFFGVAVIEAIAAGCRPVLPDRLSYPGIIPAEHHDTVLYPEGGLVDGLRDALARPIAPPGLVAAMARFSWDTLAPEYDRQLESVASMRRANPSDQDPWLRLAGFGDGQGSAEPGEVDDVVYHP
jgi:glycosyltransferase involved in cell wall biosynthesis